jgi:hypothetical protein
MFMSGGALLRAERVSLKKQLRLGGPAVNSDYVLAVPLSASPEFYGNQPNDRSIACGSRIGISDAQDKPSTLAKAAFSS